jgi:hypothetical protein
MVGCNSPSSLIKLIEVDLPLEEELEQYESEFGEMNFWTCNL